MGRRLDLLMDRPNRRQCGECSLCCTVMAVDEIKKPENVKCNLLTPMGKCSVHHTGKPASCAEYQCLWLAGAMPEELKPNRSRIVADTDNSGQIVVFHVHPRDRGAWNKPAVRKWMDSISDRLMIVVVCGEERIAFGLHADRNVRFVEVESKGVKRQWNIVIDDVDES